ncbi:MAG: GNAT family N-acetyltransferase, partial [Acidimicrobiia bacterium]|nr:GNAT family N-acetyltransferase [Acidimicrobiia bacterium]
MLDNGSVVSLRAIRPDDGPRLLDMAERCSDRTLYYRFFSPPPLPVTEEALGHLVGVDGHLRVALVAVLGSGEDERIVAVGRWDVPEDDPSSAEVAFIVEDAYQGSGLGTALLGHLAAIAPRHGIRRFEAEVLGDNRAMLHVFGHAGYRVTHELDAGVYHVVFPIHPTPESLGAAAARERDALAAGLAAFCEPRRIAIVGAGRDPRSVGGSMMRNVLAGGFTGSVVPVNTRADAVAGVATYDEVGDLPPGVDLAVIAVPAAESLAVVDACGEAGVKSVLVAAAGFGEAREAELLECCRSHGMRLLGPASMGVVNTDPRVSLRLVAGSVDARPGVVGIATQTGALGIGVLDYLRSLNLGVSQFVSLGNRVDVSSNDLLAYWEQQEATRVVLLYLESFGNPRRFVRLARRVARRKPIAVVAVGDTANHAAERGLYRQAGVIRTRSLEELVDVAALLASQPVPRGRRVAIVSNAGGAATIAAAALDEAGLEPARLAPETLAAVAPYTEMLGAPANPIELPPIADDEARYAAVLDAVGADAAVDAVLVIYTPLHRSGADRVGRAIASASRRAPAVTFVANFLGSRGVPDVLRRGRVAVPSFLFPESAAVALGHAVAYGSWLAQPEGDLVRPPGLDREAVRAVLAGEP